MTYKEISLEYSITKNIPSIILLLFLKDINTIRNTERGKVYYIWLPGMMTLCYYYYYYYYYFYYYTP